MRVLILGESDSRGRLMPDSKMGWGNQLAAELQTLTGSDVETVHVNFYPWGRRSVAYLESILARGPFDVVVISATKAGFTSFSAHERIRRLGGARAGDWFLRAAKEFDARTRWGKGPGLALSANQFAHRAMVRVIGQAPPTSAKGAIEGYVRAFARLARLEDTEILVVIAPGMPGREATRPPRLAKQVAEFRRVIQEEAERRRFAVVDSDAVLPAAGPAREAMFVDAVHKSAEAHRLVGMAGAIAIVDIAPS